MLSVDTGTGFDRVVVIDTAWGLGENVVKGAVDPDEYQVFKPLLQDRRLKPIVQKKLGAKAMKMIYGDGSGATVRNVPTSKIGQTSFVPHDDDILTLARWACAIETHYGRSMDIECEQAPGEAPSACYEINRVARMSAP
jgi:pyruvate, water dikinase